jgi:type IV pilus assembly protein PilC
MNQQKIEKEGSGKHQRKQRGRRKKVCSHLNLGGGPTNEDISIFTRQMSTLVHAGLPLLRSLEVMIKQQEKKPKFKEMLRILFRKKFLLEEICRTG